MKPRGVYILLIYPQQTQCMHQKPNIPDVLNVMSFTRLRILHRCIRSSCNEHRIHNIHFLAPRPARCLPLGGVEPLLLQQFSENKTATTENSSDNILWARVNPRRIPCHGRVARALQFTRRKKTCPWKFLKLARVTVADCNIRYTPSVCCTEQQKWKLCSKYAFGHNS